MPGPGLAAAWRPQGGARRPVGGTAWEAGEPFFRRLGLIWIKDSRP